jgi:hypothetical protein
MRVNTVDVFCIPYMENKRMKPVEIVLRSEGGKRGRKMEER